MVEEGKVGEPHYYPVEMRVLAPTLGFLIPPSSDVGIPHHSLATTVSLYLVHFLVVYDRRMNLVPVTPIWLEEELPILRIFFRSI